MRTFGGDRKGRSVAILQVRACAAAQTNDAVTLKWKSFCSFSDASAAPPRAAAT
jgi:hypothetical protein